MRPSSVFWYVVLFCATQLAPFAIAAKPPQNPLDKAWAKIETPGPTLGAREVTGYILEAAGGPEHQQRTAQIETALNRLEQMQDRTPASKTYGNFHWYWRETKPGDLNAVEFVTQQAVLVRLRFADRLSPAARDALNRLLQLSVEGIHRHRVSVAYTNIFLMKTWNLLALSQALQDAKLADEGDAMLDQWVEHTSKNGISEFLSPTYYGVDLDSLALMARVLSNPPVQAKAERILRLFWADIAANWFEPCRRLGGAHGRDYDYLTGHGDLDRHLLDAGWIDDKQRKPNAFHVFDEATRWTPPEDLHRQAISNVPRFVFQKWNSADADWASQYVGHHFSLGVAGCSQGPEDKPFALNLAGPAGPKTVVVNFFMDGRGDPYGTNKIPTGASGHKKAHHLTPLFSAVQSGPEVLFLASYPYENRNSRKPEGVPACLLSHMDLPVEAEVWTADKAASPALASQPLAGNMCFLRIGDVAVGIHFMLAVDTAGRPVTPQLVNDGAAKGARRLTVVHSSGPSTSGRATVAVRVRAAEGLDAAGFAAFRRSCMEAKTSAAIDGVIVRLEASGLQSALALEVDLAKGQLRHSAGADPKLQVAPASMNGKEYCKASLKTTTP